MKHLNCIVIAASICCLPPSAFGYEDNTHRRLSEHTFDTSGLLRNPSILFNLGIFPFGVAQQFSNSQGKARAIRDLLADGAVFEDIFPKPIHHFYDPVNDRPLKLDPTKTCGGVSVFGGERSPDWALEDNATYSSQAFSYRDAKNLLVQALTAGQESTRKQRFGQYFETLGHVLHHIQDMAQPEHVRNDQHLSAFGIKSAYESTTEDLANVLPTGGYAPIANLTPRTYWHTEGGTGIADFTNRNFLSNDTHFAANAEGLLVPAPCFPKPDLSGAALEIKDIRDPSLLGPATGLHGHITFITTPVVDFYPGRQPNPAPRIRISTFSIFDKELNDAGAKKVFALNRFNFQDYRRLLLPRAVGYGAGFLDSMFRGRLQIDLPDDGVYARVDMGRLNAGTQGFNQVKLKLKNVTPDVNVGGQLSPQDMGQGTLVLVARYHVNACFRLDLADALNTANGWQGCRSVQEFYSVSAPVVDTVPKTTAKSLSFNFATPIPVAATDLYFQVVDRGPQVLEADAVVVTAKDVSEPTFVELMNASDYVFFFDGHYYTHQQILSDPALTRQLDRNGDGTPDVTVRAPGPQTWTVSNFGIPFFTFQNMPVARYGRMAFLGDNNAFMTLTLSVTGTGCNGGTVALRTGAAQLLAGLDPGPGDDMFFHGPPEAFEQFRAIYTGGRTITCPNTVTGTQGGDLEEMILPVDPAPFPSTNPSGIAATSRADDGLRAPEDVPPAGALTTHDPDRVKLLPSTLGKGIP